VTRAYRVGLDNSKGKIGHDFLFEF
jgi:hypothetical protein